MLVEELIHEEDDSRYRNDIDPGDFLEQPHLDCPGIDPEKTDCYFLCRRRDCWIAEFDFQFELGPK